MNTAVVYFNSACGVERFSKLDYAFQVDLKIYVNEKEVSAPTARDLEVILNESKDKVLAKTSQPSTQELINVYEKALETYDHVVVVTPSKYLSGTHQNALLAAKEFDNQKIRVVESKSFALSEYILVDRFISLRESSDIDSITQILSELAHHLETYIIPGGFEFLKLSGRVSAPKALVASILNVKVIIRHVEPDITETKTDVAEVFYQGRGYNGVFKEVTKLLSNPKLKRVFLASIFEDQKLKDQFLNIAKKLDVEVVDVGVASPIMYSHIGPGSFGFALELDE